MTVIVLIVHSFVMMYLSKMDTAISFIFWFMNKFWDLDKIRQLKWSVVSLKLS